MGAKESQPPGGMGGDELFQKQLAEQPREHAYGEEEAGPAGDPALAIKRDAAARHNHVDVRMVGERRAPGVEDGEDADVGAEVLEIGRDVATTWPSLGHSSMLAAADRQAPGSPQDPMDEHEPNCKPRPEL